MKLPKGIRPTIRPAASVAKFLWPHFVAEHGCAFLGEEPGFNPPPANDTATGWESFVNHTHILDEFRNKATNRIAIDATESLTVIEETFDEIHPDFIAACELGRSATLLWALKLKQEFPGERFRVYYTEYDNPIVRFHTVRETEPFWISDEALRAATSPDFRNALIYDTANLSEPVCGPFSVLN